MDVLINDLNVHDYGHLFNKKIFMVEINGVSYMERFDYVDFCAYCLVNEHRYGVDFQLIIEIISKRRIC